MPEVTIIDYGMGNLLSVARAFEHCGSTVVLTDSPEKIEQADCLVLPGVGAFADGMAGLSSRGLVGAIKSFAASGKRFMGICLGMQMMLESSEEFGRHDGLGLIPGKILAIPSTDSTGCRHKIPHISWSELLLPTPETQWDATILYGLRPGTSSCYFVHSYFAMPDHPEHRLADCSYNGRTIPAVIRSGSLYGCQFHPEKSGDVGLAIIRNFIELT